MRSNSELDSQRRPSFIEAARRKQIVDTAIRTIAEYGYKKASLAEIAREAGISKGVISYHFEGKDQLVDEILARLVREPAKFVKGRVDSQTRAIDKLRTYIEANFAFMQLHRDNYVALVDLWGSRVSATGANPFNAEVYEPSRSYLANIIEQGVASGAFRELHARPLASVIQGAIDGVMLQWVLDENSVDLDQSCQEISEMVARHVR